MLSIGLIGAHAIIVFACLPVAGLQRLPVGLSRLRQAQHLAASFNRLSVVALGNNDDDSTGSNSSGRRGSSGAFVLLRPPPPGPVGRRIAGGGSLPAGLVSLSLAHNVLTALPAGLLVALPALTHLDISHNRLRELPESLCTLVQLVHLFTAHNALASLPATLSRLSALQTLDLSDNPLRRLSGATVAALAALTALRAQRCGLDELQWDPHMPTPVLPHLADLQLSGNRLVALPRGLLRALPMLASLGLAGNALTDEGVDAGAACSCCCTGSKQDSGNGDRYHYCSMCNNSSSSSGSALPPLRHLDVSRNCLTMLAMWLPSTVCYLDASGNRIEQLHSTQLAPLRGGLVTLMMHDNLLSSLPSELTLLTQLRVLGLSGNPGVDPEAPDADGNMLWAWRWVRRGCIGGNAADVSKAAQT